MLEEFGVAGVGGVAAAFGVAVLVFRDVHDEAGDGADGGVGAGAGAGLVLALLVVGFPAQAEFEAGLAALLGVRRELAHAVLIHTTTEGEFAVGHKSGCNQAQDGYFSEDPVSGRKTQQRIPPLLRIEEFG